MSMMLADERKRRVLGITRSGHPIFPIYGAETAPEGGNQGGTPGDGTNQPDPNAGTGDSGGGTNAEPPAPPEGESELDLWKRRAAAADRAKGDLARELQTLKDKEKSDLERATGEVDRLNKELKAALEARDAALVQAEILKFPGYEWHDPDTLLALIDRSAIEIGEDGRVTGVKDAVKKLADSKPYLLKSKPGDKKQQPDKPTNNGSSGGTPSGQQPANGAPNQQADQRQALATKYHLGSY
jgi:hypothetical protein